MVTRHARATKTGAFRDGLFSRTARRQRSFRLTNIVGLLGFAAQGVCTSQGAPRLTWSVALVANARVPLIPFDRVYAARSRNRRVCPRGRSTSDCIFCIIGNLSPRPVIPQ